MDNGNKRRRSLTGADRLVLILMAVLAVILAVITVLSRTGLKLIRGEFYLMLPVALLLTAIAWGVSLLFRRIRRRAIRIVAGVLLAVLAFIVVVIGISYISFLATLTVPQRYNTVASDAGRRLVVMRMLDPDEARIEQRRAARLAADPEGEAGVIADDWGYVYTAYAPAAGLFYRSDSLIEGEVHIGYASKAQLMVDWEEDGTVGRFFVKDPEAGDGGELRARAG